MFERLRAKFREFIDDPLGTAIEWAVYLVMLAVGVAILIWAIRYAIGIVR